MRLKKRKRSAKLINVALILVALCLIGYGGSYFYQRYSATKPHPVPSPAVVVNHNVSTPDENPIAKDTDYKVAPNMPRQIILPSIGTQGFIQQVAVDKKTNEIAVPTNINLAGWYTASVKPGDNGLSVIDGHVLGYYKPAIFEKLGKLKIGDSFSIEYGDRSIRSFQVVNNTSYPVDEVIGPLLRHDPAIQQQLNLITCGGNFNKTTHHYDKRVLVIAKRV